MTEKTNRQADLAEKRRLALRKMMRQAGMVATEPERIPPRTGEGPPPLSFAQQRLWFLDRLMPGNPFYNIDIAIPIQAWVDWRALERTLNEIVRRHEVLRTSFPEKSGRPVQEIAPSLHIPLSRVDLTHLSRPERRAEAKRLAAQEAQQSFDLEEGPLLAAKLVTYAPDDHLLLLTLHHIVADGWSLRILSRELQAIYTAYAQQRDHELPGLAIQYADFALWQRNHLEGEALDRLLTYWREQLVDLPQLKLPVNRQRPAVPTFEGAFVSVVIPRSQSEQVKQRCSEEGVTPYVLLLTAFAILLNHYTKSTDIALGSPIASRTRQEVENLIGFFVNTLVIRLDLGGDPSASEALQRTRKVVLEAFAHQELPFERLVEELQPERVLNQNPLFQTIFQLFTPPDAAANAGRSTAEVPEIQRGTSKFDLRFDLWDTPDGYQGQLEYSTDLFDHASIEWMARHFVALLTDLLQNPARPISTLTMTTTAERRLILDEWNNTKRAYPAEIGVHRLFEEQAARLGDQPAILDDDQVLTYRQLDEAANRLAWRLQATGIRDGDRVGVFLDRTATMVIAWLGVLKAGAAYVPFDPTYPAARLAFMIDDARVAAIITTEALAVRLPPTAVERLFVPGLVTTEDPTPTPFHSRQVGGEALAYVMYTSGSTGRPKGTCIPHRAINRLVINTNYLTIQPGERVGQASNAAFDAATFEVWGPLLQGGQVVDIPREVVLSPHQLAARLEQVHIDHLFLTTAVFNQVIQEKPTAFAGLKTLMVGGSKVNPGLMRHCLEKGRPQRLLNAYGPTESTTFATYFEIDAIEPAAGSIPIGRPLANTTVFVLDDRGRPSPVGVPGELFIGGDGLASGYFERPELTAARFVSHPFQPGERLYGTGDVVRWLPSGDIDFIGRVDNQVKIRGFRVELDEIARALTSHRAIQDAVVAMRDDEGDRPRIVAYMKIAEAYGPALGAAQRAEEGAALVEQWQTIYDSVIYRDIDRTGGEVDPVFNLAGWIDTATGAPIPAEEMGEQVDQAVARIRRCGGERILEIGCGTGLLLFRLAPGSGRYVGTDISDVTLAFVRQHLDRTQDFPQVTLHQLTATDTVRFGEDAFDTIVLNSVVQYFPGADYFMEVLAQALKVAGPGGAIFVGDVRNLALLETFHTEVELSRAADTHTLGAVREQVHKQLSEEQELLIDPKFFASLPDRFPEIGTVEIQLKRGNGRNELTKYRYDVIIRLNPVDGAPLEPQEAYWRRDVDSIEAIESLLAGSEIDALRILEIPNGRLRRALAAQDLLATRPEQDSVGELHQALNPQAGLDPETLWTLTADCRYEVRISWGSNAGQTGTFEALFVRRELAGRPVPPSRVRGELLPPDRYTSDPLRGRFIRNLVPALQTHLQEIMPEYMMPASYVQLETIPLTPNGKIDYQALPAPDRHRPALAHHYVPPRSDLEWRLAGIWSDVLSIDTPGIHDDFFIELGGHSLLATQVISRIRREFALELPLSVLFETPTIAAVAVKIEQLHHETAGAAMITRDDEPLSAEGLPVDAMSDEEVEAMLAALIDEESE